MKINFIIIKGKNKAFCLPLRLEQTLGFNNNNIHGRKMFQSKTSSAFHTHQLLLGTNPLMKKRSLRNKIQGEVLIQSPFFLLFLQRNLVSAKELVGVTPKKGQGRVEPCNQSLWQGLRGRPKLPPTSSSRERSVKVNPKRNLGILTVWGPSNRSEIGFRLENEENPDTKR